AGGFFVGTTLEFDGSVGADRWTALSASSRYSPSAPCAAARPTVGRYGEGCWLRQGPPFGRGAGSGLHCPARHQALIFPMLQKLRDKTSGWIVTVIMGLLMIPFLFVIDNSYLGGVGGQNVAKVSAPPS